MAGEAALISIARRAAHAPMWRFGQSPLPKLGKMLFSIASANVGNCGLQPRPRSFALLTRLLLSPRLRCDVAFPIDGGGRFNFPASQRKHSLCKIGWSSTTL